MEYLLEFIDRIKKAIIFENISMQNKFLFYEIIKLLTFEINKINRLNA